MNSSVTIDARHFSGGLFTFSDETITALVQRNLIASYVGSSGSDTENIGVTRLLTRFPGLVANRLYYWESKGWVTSTKVQKRKRIVRMYLPMQAARIERMWTLVQAGYAPRQAAKMSKENVLFELTDGAKQKIEKYLQSFK